MRATLHCSLGGNIEGRRGGGALLRIVLQCSNQIAGCLMIACMGSQHGAMSLRVIEAHMLPSFAREETRKKKEMAGYNGLARFKQSLDQTRQTDVVSISSLVVVGG